MILLFSYAGTRLPEALSFFGSPQALIASQQTVRERGESVPYSFFNHLGQEIVHRASIHFLSLRTSHLALFRYKRGLEMKSWDGNLFPSNDATMWKEEYLRDRLSYRANLPKSKRSFKKGEQSKAESLTHFIFLPSICPL